MYRWLGDNLGLIGNRAPRIISKSKDNAKGQVQSALAKANGQFQGPRAKGHSKELKAKVKTGPIVQV